MCQLDQETEVDGAYLSGSLCDKCLIEIVKCISETRQSLEYWTKEGNGEKGIGTWKPKRNIMILTSLLSSNKQ